MISLKKKTAEWWDAFSKDKSYKRFIKTDFSKWCEEEDREYMGDFGPADDMGGMGGMGGMDFGAPPHASNRARQAITGGTSTAALCRGHGGTCLTLCFCTQVEWAWAAWVWMAWAAWATLATATTCRRSDEEVCPRPIGASPACLSRRAGADARPLASLAAGHSPLFLPHAGGRGRPGRPGAVGLAG